MARTGIVRLADRMGRVVHVRAALEAGGAPWAGIVGAAAFALGAGHAGLAVVVPPAAIRAAGGGPVQAVPFLSALALGATLSGATIAMLGGRVECLRMGGRFAAGLTGLQAGTAALAFAPRDEALLAGGGLLAGSFVAPLTPFVTTLVQTQPPRAPRADALGVALSPHRSGRSRPDPTGRSAP